MPSGKGKRSPLKSFDAMGYKQYKCDPYVRAWNRIADNGEICSGGFDPRNNPEDRWKLAAATIAAAAFILMFVLFSSCTRKLYIPVERTTTITETVRDTVIEVMLETVHDTTRIEISGRDTVSFLKDGTHFSYATWKDGVLGHSLGTFPEASIKGTAHVRHTVIRDSIPYPVTVEVEKKLTFWQKAKIEYGGFAMGLAAAFGFLLVLTARSGIRNMD